MKKALIIVLSIILAISSGLLVYGIILGDPISFGRVKGELTEPVNPDAHASGIAQWVAEYSETHNHRTLNVATNPSKDPAIFAAEVDGWYDVFGKADPSTSILTRYSGADLVANLMVPITYNQNRSTQFCLASSYVIKAGKETSYSDNVRVRQQSKPAYVDFFYQSSVWTGSPISSLSSLRVRFGTQLLKSLANTIDSYDPKTGECNVAYRSPKKESTDGELDREVPFKTYDLLNFPIYLGNGEDKNNDYNAVIDSSVVDSSTVKLSRPTSTHPYYVLTFSEDLVTAQRKENTEDRLNAALGDQMENIKIKKADFVVEIWECGLFRQMHADIVVNAKIDGRQGDVSIDMDYKFYYDDYNCDVVRLILEKTDNWAKYLNAANKEELYSRKKTY